MSAGKLSNRLPATRLDRWSRFKRRFYGGPSYLAHRPLWMRRHRSPTATAALWVYAWALRLFSLPGRVMLLCTGLLVLYSSVSLRMPSHLLALVMVSLFTVDLVVGFLLFRPRVWMVRRVPDRIAVGAEATVEYTIENRGRRTAFGLALETLPWPKGLDFPGGLPYIPALAAGQSLRLSAPIRGLQRGRYQLPALRVHSGLPFNLTHWGMMNCTPKTIHVTPAFAPLAQLKVPGQARHQPGGIALSSQVAESMEFFGCREYRDGDNPRHIHWPSWARTGFPVVKEYHEEYFYRTTLILDTFRPLPWWSILRRPESEPEFEGAVSLTAAIADYLAGRDYVIDLFAAGRKIYRFQGGRGLGGIDDILEILACVPAQPEDLFAEIGPEITPEITQISSALFILQSWDRNRRDLIEKVAANGVEARIFLIAEHPPAAVRNLPGIIVFKPSEIMRGVNSLRI